MIKYGKEQIKTLEDIKAIRLRAGMYIGSVGPEGVRHITLEIISNVIDEYLNGYCTICNISLNDNGSITIEDNGRGVPTGKRENGSETLEVVFTKLHTGAKFDSTGQNGYNTSGGMNGVGAKATNALSEYFIVEVKRENKLYKMTFEKGHRKSYEITPLVSTETGTKITFKPDAEIFKEGTDIDYDSLKKQITELSFLSQGLVFKLNNKGKEEEITSANGLLDYLDYLNKGKTITNKFFCETKEDRLGVKLALVYNEGYSETYKLYTNSIPNSAGTHLTGFRAALTGAVNEYAREKKILKEKDENLSGDDLKEGLVLALSLVMPDPVFSGQTKDTLTSSEGRGVVQRLVSKEIRVWLDTNPNDAKAIINKALLSKKARAAAKKARETTRKKTGGFSSVLPGKLADCSSKKAEECEIFITEGDSAGGTAKSARNRKTQAILPVRGKILNVAKADLSKALANEEIKSMITAFGLTLDKNKITVDESKLRYHKIVILSDADVDGAHIQTLFFTFIWTFAPDLFHKGYIYAAVPPLYKVTIGKESFYLKDDAALEEYKSTHMGRNYSVQRFKGLGEMDADELRETVMNPEKRTLKQITIENVIQAGNTVRNLMSGSPAIRKSFIEANANRANIDI